MPLHPAVIAFDNWLATKQARVCLRPLYKGRYLGNRLKQTFAAGWAAAESGERKVERKGVRNGTVTITHTHRHNVNDVICIVIEDKLDSRTILEAELTIEDFGSAVVGVGSRECLLTLYNLPPAP